MRSVLSVHLFLGPTCSLYPASRLVVLVDVVIVVVSYFHFFLLVGCFPVLNFLEGISRAPETAARVLC